jgi:ribosome recycling factor
MIKDIQQAAKTKMQKAIESLETHLAVLRTSRANPSMLSKIMVEYYGSTTPIHSMANITAPDARTLVITPYDRTGLAAMEKAIRDSDLGFNPANKGDALWITVPALTEERRKDLVKNAKNYAEEARVAVRNARRDGMEAVKKLEKDKKISTDEMKRSESEIQKLTDDFTRQVDQVLERKETEILG